MTAGQSCAARNLGSSTIVSMKCSRLSVRGSAVPVEKNRLHTLFLDLESWTRRIGGKAGKVAAVMWRTFSWTNFSVNNESKTWATVLVSNDNREVRLG